MTEKIIFEELTKDERILLLRAFDYDVDNKGFIITPAKMKIPSKEIPEEYINVKSVALTPGSLKVIDGTPTAISKFIREKVEINDPPY